MKWEYVRCYFTGTGSPLPTNYKITAFSYSHHENVTDHTSTWQEVFRRLGEAGWELVSVTEEKPQEGAFFQTSYFKRRYE